MADNLLTNLLDFSRQLLQVGTPPSFVFDEAGRRVPTEMVMLSLAARQTEALEKIAAALPHVLEARTAPDGVTRIHASLAKGTTTVFVQVTKSTPEQAKEYFDTFSEVAEQAVNEANNQQEGGPANG